MSPYRISEPAKADIAAILRRSEELHGKEGRIRYRACLTAAMRRVAADPEGRSTVVRSSFPAFAAFTFATAATKAAPVANPAHVLLYRVLQTNVVEIVRVLHNRMESGRRLGSDG